MIGEHIGDYEVIGSLGKGGFGAVYKAKASDGTELALKILNPQALDNKRVVKKFFHEAMILAKLDHPNITKLMEFFPDGENYALVMEFVEGVELKSVIQKYKGPMPFELAYKIANQALDAFQYAHQNGILHRDIKPGNIIIDKNGDAKIMDFGIAKMSSAASHDTAASMLSVHYVPPERFDKTKEIDQRSDIYSLGLVLYEMFAGRRPFNATETAQVMFCHMNQIPDPPTKFSPALPENISAAITKALEKDPNDRFNTFMEFKAALQLEQDDFDDATAILDSDMTLVDQMPGMPVAEGAEKETGKKKNPMVLVAAILVPLLIIGGAAGYFLTRSNGNGNGKLAVSDTAVPESKKYKYLKKNGKGFHEFQHPADSSTLVLVPTGPFTMGSAQYSAEEPVQQIAMDDYYIDKYLVTNAQFQKFVTQTQHQTNAEKEGAGMVRIGRRWKKVDGASWKTPDGLTPIEGKENNPVSQVSYNDALAYCQWAQKDLPTEAQWEKAARGPEGNVYPWGSTEPNSTMANFDNIVGSTTPVTEYEKGQSYYGVFDMAGNVYQWTKDWYGTGQRQEKNPTGPAEGEERVIKGGSFIEGVESLRSPNRDRYDPNYSSFLFGFRCACTE
ncbi:MAG: SUMF1/EgtB/PvdO family nonheme iron enzyme [Desulfobacterales bacterium]|nr:SUMF1/EgtB/PvdO family nonheme iron enzyme [Desulfobacterales bacterium]